MKLSTLVVGLCVLASIGIASAQEHYTERPVGSCSSYRTKQGHTDDYLLYLRSHYLATTAESKKQGLTLDSKIFMQQPASPADRLAELEKAMPALEQYARQPQVEGRFRQTVGAR